ncbi:class I SAM-dependent methyltransferase [Thiolapillus sp.]
MKLPTSKPLRKIFPAFLKARLRKHISRKRIQSKYKSLQKSNKNLSPEEIFTRIYRNNEWGGKKGEFCSGEGSVDKNIVSSYIKTITEKAATEQFKGLEFVDLGCGDFRIGSHLVDLSSKYTGVDIVKPLIKRNQKLFGNEKTNFLCLNIAEDDLPDGDVCFIRQVFQHMSNEQILKVLKKLHKYQWVFITEHYPNDDMNITPNLDKVPGGDIRVVFGSAVYLSEHPFNLNEDALEMVLKVRGTEIEDGVDPGFIITYLYKPNSLAN